MQKKGNNFLNSKRMDIRKLAAISNSTSNLQRRNIRGAQGLWSYTPCSGGDGIHAHGSEHPQCLLRQRPPPKWVWVQVEAGVRCRKHPPQTQEGTLRVDSVPSNKCLPRVWRWPMSSRTGCFCAWSLGLPIKRTASRPGLQSFGAQVYWLYF